MMDPNKKVALITGSGSGLGEAAAISFAKEGIAVVLNGRRKEKIEQVKQKIEQNGGEAIAIQADVSSEQDVIRLTDEIVKTYGRIDILINNAGVFQPGLLIETTLEDWNEQIQSNLTGAFLVTRACLPLMRAQSYGRIVNITSSLAQNGAGGYAAYSASKAGLESLTRTAAEEEGSHNILVNLFSPGTLKTEMHATGRDPYSVIPQLWELATLPKHGCSGKLLEFK
jgi:3-oxoacyl-[acyl-carrier protein] reductase